MDEDEVKEVNEFDDFDPKKAKSLHDDDLPEDLDDGFHSEEVAVDPLVDPLDDEVSLEDERDKEEAEEADADKYDDEDLL